MKLAAAARRFDKQVFADAYATGTTFKGQMNLFDDTVRDGMTVERRIISVAPTVTIPARRTVTSDNLTWLIGDSQRDYYNGAAIRHKYVAHQATELATVKTFDQALSASAGLAAWGARVWIKGAKEIEVSSDVLDVFDIYFATGEAVSEGHLVNMGGRWHLVRSTYPSSAGLLVALADELPEPVITSLAFRSRVYLPVTDTWSVDPTTIAALRFRWQSHFRYPSSGADKFSPGDFVVVVLKSAITPKAGDEFTHTGTDYRVAAVIDEGTTWALHVRRD